MIKAFDIELLALMKPGREYTAEDMAVKSKAKLGAVRPSLTRMVKAGILRSEQITGTHSSISIYRLAEQSE